MDLFSGSFTLCDHYTEGCQSCRNQLHPDQQHKNRLFCCRFDQSSAQQQHFRSRGGRSDCGVRLKLSKQSLVTLLLRLSLLIATLHEASASGRLVEPTMRSSLWRFDPDAPVNYNDQGLNCGGLQIQYGLNAGLCGVCGDPYSGLRDNEDGGLYASGGVVRRYRSGSRVTMVADLVVPKGGYFEVKLCPRDQLTTIVTQECFDAFTLEIKNGQGRSLQVGTRPRQDSGLYKLEVQLPPGVTCTHCVLQWRYVTAPTSPSASYGLSSTGGTTCADCPGPREEFRNCADVTIGYYGDQEVSPGQPDDLTRGLLREKIQTYIFSTGVDSLVVNREKKNNRFASGVDFTDNDDSSEEDDDDDDERRYRPGRFSEWPQRLPTERPGQDSGFGYATLLLGSQGRGDQALERIRENLNRNNRQKLLNRQRAKGGSSSEESDESDDDDDDYEDRVTVPRRLPGLEQNTNEINIPAIDENYNRHNGVGDKTGMGYGDQYGYRSGDYTTEVDGTLYGDSYGGQNGVKGNSGSGYGDQYGTGDYISVLDGQPFGDNYDGQNGNNPNTGLDYDNQFATDTGDYNSGLRDNLPGVSIDPFAGLFGGNVGGQSFVVPGNNFIEPPSKPYNGNVNSFMNTADPSNPFVAFFSRDKSTSAFQDSIDSYGNDKTSGMSYADLMDRKASRQTSSSAGDRESYPAETSNRLSKPPASITNEFYSDSVEPGHDHGNSLNRFPNERVSDNSNQETNSPPLSSYEAEQEINPPGSPLSPQRIIKGIKSALERLVSPGGSRKRGVLDVQTDILLDRLARLVSPPTPPRVPPTRSEPPSTRQNIDRSPLALPGLTPLPNLISERSFDNQENLQQFYLMALQQQEQLLGGLQPPRQGFNLNFSLSSDSVPSIGSPSLPGLFPGQDSLPPMGSPYHQESLPPLGPIPSHGPLPPMMVHHPADPSLSHLPSHLSGLPTAPSQNPNSPAFHWLPGSAHDMSAMGDNFHFLNAHAANQYLSPYAEAARAQPSLLCSRPELLVCMATPTYRQAIPGADIICTESCRRGEACGPEYCTCACQQTVQCFHQSSFRNTRNGQRIFVGSSGVSNADAWCTGQCNSGSCPNDQCVCNLV